MKSKEELGQELEEGSKSKSS
ncbi:hypothetical protein A2U01_0112180, partial [Trifolium medium]|nr:hypothetical protein [Trifolium medium]